MPEEPIEKLIPVIYKFLKIDKSRADYISRDFVL